MASRAADAESGGGLSLGACHRHVDVAEGAGVCGARVSDRGRLHGSGQLGHRSRGRLRVRLPAAVRDSAVESDGGVAAGAVVEARHRHGARSRAGVPRSLLASRRDLPMDHLRDGDRGVRSRRGHRLGDRAQPALSHPDHRRRGAHGVRRARRALSADEGIPLARGARDRADRDDRDVLSLRGRDLEAVARGGARGLRAECARSCAIRGCSTSRWVSSARQ